MNEKIKTLVIEKMDEEYMLWLEIAKEQSKNGEIEITPAIEERLTEIAVEFGFEYLYKTSYALIFVNKTDFLIAWHNDHDADWGIDETGFDALDLQNELFSDEDRDKIMWELVYKCGNEFLTEKEIETIEKKVTDESDNLTNAERQTLHRIRIKRENILKSEDKLNFFKKFRYL